MIDAAIGESPVINPVIGEVSVISSVIGESSETNSVIEKSSVIDAVIGVSQRDTHGMARPARWNTTPSLLLLLLHYSRSRSYKVLEP